MKGFTVWFTGLSGAGKTTLAAELRKRLIVFGFKVEILDGDIIRDQLSPNLGFTKECRNEHIKRIAFVASLLSRHGVIVLASAISPYRSTREEVRSKLGDFVEVFVNAPLEVCEVRDVKGLYSRARKGEVARMTGITDPYEPPESPDIECRTDLETIDESVFKIVAHLSKTGFFGSCIDERS